MFTGLIKCQYESVRSIRCKKFLSVSEVLRVAGYVSEIAESNVVTHVMVVEEDDVRHRRRCRKCCPGN